MVVRSCPAGKVKLGFVIRINNRDGKPRYWDEDQRNFGPRSEGTIYKRRAHLPKSISTGGREFSTSYHLEMKLESIEDGIQRGYYGNEGVPVRAEIILIGGKRDMA
jgi:hypothetical protein